MEPPLTKTEAAKYLNVSERYIDRLWAERRITAIKYGRLIRFQKSDLDAFIKASRIEAVR